MKFYNTICIYLHFANLSNKYIDICFYIKHLIMIFTRISKRFLAIIPLS
ncbi:hypothetical protein NEISICOT_03450 [Neisseria sicca ATCC 29256]|uniref:Uncharacterized protein n=1 Tax=Neisseria sicca ATCC 29256 TaxID=547045 RepID=C6MA68_NEISI|nr:hypothetical protein NEISICOT_03450 [Neisseria sicca ATCC 29256]